MASAWTGVLLAIASAIGWACLDVVRKQLALRAAAVALLWAMAVSQMPLFATWAFFDPRPFDAAAYAAPGAATLVLNLAANLAFIKALEIGALSRTIPMLSLTPVITIVTGAVLLGEWPEPAQGLGMVLVVVGSLLLAVAKGQGGFRVEPGTVLMLAVAVMWSFSAAVDKLALRSISVPGHGLVQSVGMFATWSVVLAVRNGRREVQALRPLGPQIIAAAAIMGTSASLQYFAIERTLVSLVETIKRAVGATAALVLGRALFSESIGLREILAAALVVFGTALVLAV